MTTGLETQGYGECTSPSTAEDRRRPDSQDRFCLIGTNSGSRLMRTAGLPPKRPPRSPNRSADPTTRRLRQASREGSRPQTDRRTTKNRSGKPTEPVSPMKSHRFRTFDRSMNGSKAAKRRGLVVGCSRVFPLFSARGTAEGPQRRAKGDRRRTAELSNAVSHSEALV